MLAAPLPLAPPVKPPVTVGVDQLYVVPAGTMPSMPFTGIEVKPTPPHVVATMLLIVGSRFTVTTTVKAVPIHEPDVGVTMYVAVWAVFVELVRVPVIPEPLPADPPVMPPVTEGIDQLYVVPTGTMPLVPFTGVEVKEIPLQTVEVILVIVGVGFTVTVTDAHVVVLQVPCACTK